MTRQFISASEERRKLRDRQQQLAAKQGLLQWIEHQGDVNWTLVTFVLHGKSMKNDVHPGEARDRLQKVLGQTLIRFEQKVLGNAVKRRGDHLLCVLAFGGEPKDNIFIHSQGLLEHRSRQNMDLESLRKLLEIEWNKSLKRILRWDPTITAPLLIGEVWMEPAWNDLTDYVNYIQRHEGATLDSGLTKVDIKNLFLRCKTDDITYSPNGKVSATSEATL